MKRKWISLFLLVILSMTAAFPALADDNIRIYVDGQELITDTPPIIGEGSTLVPMRAIFEALDASVEYDSSTQQVTGTKGENTILLTINQQTALKNGTVVELSVAPQIMEGRTLVPLRFVSDAESVRYSVI